MEKILNLAKRSATGRPISPAKDGIRELMSPQQVGGIKSSIKSEDDVEAKDSDGNTPLVMASCNGNADEVQLLLESGADEEVRNKKGKSACDLAKGKVVKGLLDCKR